MDEIDWSTLNPEATDVWRRNAAFWDERMGEGNDFQLGLVHPAVERLLDVRAGQVILDLACGNGIFARRLADLGACVVGCDLEPMIALALERNRRYAEQIEYLAVDLTDSHELRRLGEGRFDAACCNMALMDIADIRPLLSALPDLLKPGGPFVFAISHPCFNTSGVARVLEQYEQEGALINDYSLRVRKYLTLGPEKGIAMAGQPEPQYYFNRTFTQLFGACFEAGLVIDGLEERAFSKPLPRPSASMWDRLPEIPPVLAVRARAAK